MALPNITSYAKNVAKSIVYTAVDVVKEDMPTLAAYIDQDSNRELSRSIYAGVKDYKGTIKKAQTAIKSSKIYEAAELAAKSAIDDIKTGKFYNKERIDAIEDKAAEAMFGSFEDMDVEFSFDDEDGSSEITSGDKLVAASTQVAAYKAADMVAQTQVKTTNALIKAQKASTHQMLLQSAQIIGGLKEVAFVGAQSQGALVNLTSIQENAARNSKLFYENTSKLLQESNAMMKEMLEMQRALYKNAQQQENTSKKRVGYDDVIDFDGVIDFKSYLSNIKANAKSALGEKTMGMSDFLGDMNGDMLKMMASSPLKFISEGILRALIPQATKGAAKNFDKTLSGISSTMIARFNNMAKNSDNPLMQMVGQIFGIKTTPKTSLDTSKFNKGPVPFDGIVRKSIVDVIPTYLRRIEAAITGQPEKIYDMTKGSWTDARKVKDEYNRLIKGARSEASYDLVEEISKVLNSKDAPKFQDKYSRDSFNKSLESFLNALYDNDGDFKFKSKDDAWKYGISPDDFAMIADIITNKDNKSMQRARIRHADSVMSSKSSLNSRFEQLEKFADSPLFQLFNGSTDAKNFDRPEKYEEAPRVFGGVLDLKNQKDELGYNMFFYLRNMYNELYTMRNYSGMPSMSAVRGGTGRLFTQPSIPPLAIPDVHQRTAKEEYDTGEREARRRYDEEIARHTQKGGKLYDLVDTHGNIMKNRATVEQRELLDQLEASRTSHGWLNDMLYGENTQLNAANKKRGEEGQDPISAKRFLDRMKATKNLTEKFAVMQDQINKLTKAPADMAKSLIEKADARIYSFFYGAETGEEDEEGNKIKGFMQLMSMKMNATFDKVNDFIDTKILDPIKKKLGVENMKDLMDKMGITDVWTNIKTKLFGEKDADGKYQGGIFGDVRDEVKNVFGTAKDYVFNSIKEVFSPITSRVKAAFENRPKVFRKELSEEEITSRVLESINTNRDQQVEPTVDTTNANTVENTIKNVMSNKDRARAFRNSIKLNTEDAKLDASIANLFKELGILSASKNGTIVATKIKEMAKNDPLYDPEHPEKSLNALSMSDINNAIQSANMIRQARFLRNKMNTKFNNQDVSVNTFMGNSNPGIPAPGGNIISKAHETLEKILSVIKSVVKDNAVSVEVKRKVRAPRTSSGTPRILSHVAGGRESETEGDSTGDSDGELHSSAFGNSFKNNAISALSKDELYSRNGLVGKVPSTGVYDIKAGTTIYPTKKDKAIELANEQSAISKFLSKTGIPTNAAANNAPTREYNGKVYNLGDDGKYHHYEIVDGKTYDSVLEPGFVDQMYFTAKGGFSTLLSSLGFNGLAESNPVDSVDKAMDVVKKYAPKMTAHGLLGAAVGLLSGNPLLGAAIGATSGYVNASEKAKTTLFGEEVTDEDGNKSRSGGIISKSAQDTMKKYLPNMGKYGTTGAVLGLLSPFGLVGGALLGSAVGWATTDDRIKESLFGKLGDNKSGLITKEFRDHMKKAAPNIALGAIGGLLLGPFGLMGNLVLGSGLGLASSTDGFKKFLFGEEGEDGKRHGGLAGAIKLNVVDPLKDFASTFKEKTEDFIINDMINPLKEGIKPITHEMALLTKGLVGFVPKMLNKMFESTFGRPLQDLIRDRIVSPIAAIAGKAAGITGGVGKAVISAPFKAFGAVGRSLESKHIRKGDANYISAAERLAFRDDHRARGALSNIPLLGNSIFGSLGFNPTGYRDQFRDVDETLASMQDPESLKAAMDAVESLAKGKNHFKEQNRKTGRGFMAELSAVFPSSVCGRVKKALERNDLDTVANLIRSSNPIKGVELTPQQRELLIKKAGEALTTIEENNRKSNITNDERSNLFGQLNDMGFSNIGENNINKLYELIKAEYSVKKNNTADGKTEEEKAAEEDAKRVSDPIIENATENTDRIVNALTESLKRIEEIQLASLPESEQRKVLDRMSAKQDEIARQNLKDVDEDETMSNDGKVKWQFDSVSKTFRKYIMTSDGWEEAPGKAKADADKAEEEKEERQSRSFASGIGSALLNIFRPSHTDKDTGEKKENPIVSLLKKIAKVAGIGMLGATAVAGTGHAADYMTSTGIPLIKNLWDERMKPFLKDHFGGFYEKLENIAIGIKEYITGVPGRIKSTVTTFSQWFMGTGEYNGAGLPYLFENKIFPWYLEGFHGFATKFLPPLVKTIVVSLPSIVSGIVEGIYAGIKSLFNIKDKDTAPKFNTDYSNINTSSDENIYERSSGGLNKIKPVSGGSKWWGGSNNGLSDIFSIAKSDIDVTIPASGVEDKRARNAIRDNLQANIDGSMGSARTGYIQQAIQNAKEIRASDGKELYNYEYMPTNTFGNHYDKDGNISNDNAANYLNPFDGVRSTEDRMFGGAIRWATGAKTLNAPFKILKGAGNLAKKLGPLGYLPGKGMELIGKAAEKIAPHSPNLATKLVGGKTLAEGAASNGLLSKVVKIITDGAKKVFSSDTVVSMATKVANASGKVMDTKVMRALLDSTGGKIISKLTKYAGNALSKASAEVASRIATSVSIPVIATAAFAIWDFTTGMKNARDVFGLTKNQDITLFERFIAGLLKTISGICFGLIPEDLVIDIFIDYLAPILNINVDDIKQRRAEAEAEVQAHNAETGLNLSISEYNHKDGLWNKVKSGVKKTVSSIGDGISNIYNTVKEKGIGAAVKEGGMAVVNKGAELAKNALGEKNFEFLKNIGTDVTDIFKHMTNGSPIELMKVGSGNPIQSFLTMPIKIPTVVPATVIGGVKGIVKFVSPIIKKLLNLGSEFAGNAALVGKGMLKGDIKEMLLAGNSYVDEEGNMDISQLIANIGTIPGKMIAIPPTLLIGGLRAAAKLIKPVFNAVKETGKSTINKMTQVGRYVINGDPIGLISSMGDIRNEDGSANVGSIIGSVLTGISLPLTIIPATVVGVGKKIGEFLKPVIGSVIDTAGDAINKIGGIGDYIVNGDPIGLISSMGDIRNEDGSANVGSIIGSVLTGISLPLTIIPATVVGVGKKIGEFVSPLIASIVSQANIVVEDQTKLGSMAKDGDIPGVLKYQTEGADGPLSFLHKGITFISKLVYTPIAAFKVIGKTFSTIFNTAKEISIKDMIDNMWDYTNKKKHPTMDGFDNIGKTSGNGIGDIINNTISSVVRGVGSPIVKLFRSLSSISDLIKKLKGDTDEQIEEVEESKGSSYGTGRFYQKDPRISKISFNKNGDSVRQTIGDSGCGPVAAANAVNYAYGTGADPISASKFALRYKEKDGGTHPKFFEKYFNQNGLNSNVLHGQGSIISAIKSGNPVVLMGKDRYAGKDSPYGPNPHYIVGKGIDNNGNIIVDDPESINGSRPYPATKVIGKSSVAISASKYGRGLGDYNLCTIYWPSGGFTQLSPELIISKNDIFKSPQAAGEECCKVIVYQGLFGSSHVGAYSERYMTVKTLAKIGYPITEGRKAKTTTNTNTGSNIATTATANAGDFKRMQYSSGSNKSLTQAEKYKLAIQCLPYVDKPCSSIPGPIIGTLNSYALKTGSGSVNKNSTVRTVLINQFGVRIGEIETFATSIAKVASLTLDELKSKDSSSYAKLKELAKQTIGFDISNYGHKTVGEISSNIGLTFAGDAPNGAKSSSNSTSSSSQTYSSGYETDMTSYAETEQKDNRSIFSVISDFFTSIFDYTDKYGNKKNLLNIFGIGGGSSGSSSYSSGGTTASGLSPQQLKVQQLLSSIIGKNNYNQSDRYRVGDTLNGAASGSADCSSTVQWALKNGAGIDPGGNTEAQITSKLGQWVDGPYDFGKNGNPILNNLALGDLMFYGKSGSSKPYNVSHVEMYWGNGKRIGHGSGTGPVVSPYTAKASYQQYLGAKRFIPIGSMSANGIGSTNAAGGTVEQNKQIIWTFLKNKGYNDIAAAGIMGNIEQECGFRHDLVEAGNTDNPGYGICQWTYPSRKKAFVAAVPDWKTNLGGQLDFMWQEINQSYRGVLPEAMNKCTTVSEAVWLFHNIYEGSADIQRTGGLTRRENFGAGIYQQFASNKTTSYGAGKYGMASNLGVTRNGQITSGFNDPTRVSHNGIDIAGKSGQAIISPARGTIIRSEYNDTNGNMVVIQSEDGYLYTFCHMSSRSVKVGDRVSIGSILGKMGDTGNSFGNHVHYQVTNSDGQFVDPLSIASGRKTTASANIPQPQRAIGGSDGIDYTQLIKIIIELLGTISDNTSNFAKAIKLISEKTGADLSGVDLSSKSKAITQIQDKLRALDSSYGKGKADLGSSLMGSNTDFLVKAMTAIAQS